ncbi:MAG TPA: hydroxymyristoyl-ACP dehydratase [Burkholderiales bacterium]|nr:hydroxymyristoyl-ACP dehydratase [Burkholderiales bacterium]
MLMDKAALRARIPHAGAMCLIDGVLSWDDTRIGCTTGSHRAGDNPLRRDGRLHAICGVEYAAQAMALHGALTGAPHARPRAGYLASVRDVECRVAYLDTIENDLLVEAERLLQEGSRVIYQFALRSGAHELMSGRAAVVLRP